MMHQSEKNTKRVKAAVGIVLACLCIALLIGCKGNPPSADGRPYGMLIGVSQANLVEPRCITMNNEILAEAARHDDMKLIITDAAMETERQTQDIRMLLGYGIDLLIISPNDMEALEPLLSEVLQFIPVIVMDQKPSAKTHTLYIGPDNMEIGRLAGEYIAGLLDISGGNIIEIKGRNGTVSTDERSAGFRAVLKEYPQITISRELEANWMQDQSEDRMKECLPILRHPIDAIFAHNDPMAFGAAIAMEAFRFPQVPIIGVDGLSNENGGMELVQSGVLTATIACSTGGSQAVEYARRILSGEEGLPGQIILEPRLIVAENP